MRHMKSGWALAFFILTPLMLSACSRAGSEYLGKWVSQDNMNDSILSMVLSDHIEIIRNGDSYLIESGMGGKETRKTPFVLKDGLLRGGPGDQLVLSHIEKDDTLQAQFEIFGAKYKRIN